MNKKTNQLKKYLRDNKCYYLPTCHDPLSAKLIESKGFKISFIGGFALSSAILGYPDASLITQKELVDATYAICNHTKLPVIVDADTGFGGPANVYRTVKDLEAAGASALVLEDQIFPKKCALTDQVLLLNLKEAKERLFIAIKAAKEWIDGEPLVVYLSPQGKVLQQAAVNNLAAEQSIILIAGRYEGIDERLIQLEVDQEWSIGDYVLSGGEIPAMVLIDALIRQIPGALGHSESASQDSFAEGLLDCPHYTRPDNYQDLCKNFI